MNSLLDFRTRVEQAWCSQTAHLGYTRDENPAHGQCAVTALLFHQYFGGQIKKATVVGPSSDPFRTKHYWNVYKGVDVDLTWQQFPVGSRIDQLSIKDVDSKSLTKSVRNRYNLLKERFNNV